MPSVPLRVDIIATDSLTQIDTPTRPYFVSGPNFDHMVEFTDVLTDLQFGRTAATDCTLFCSVGLAGRKLVLESGFLEPVA